MTFQEYLNLKEPQRMPDVILQEGEFIKGTTIELFKGGPKHTQIFIEYFGQTHEYVHRSDKSKLYTADGDGNPKAMSCFSLPESVTQKF